MLKMLRYDIFLKLFVIKNELKAGAINAFISSVIVSLLLRKCFPAKHLKIDHPLNLHLKLYID